MKTRNRKVKLVVWNATLESTKHQVRTELINWENWISVPNICTNDIISLAYIPYGHFTYLLYISIGFFFYTSSTILMNGVWIGCVKRRDINRSYVDDTYSLIPSWYSQYHLFYISSIYVLRHFKFVLNISLQHEPFCFSPNFPDGSTI